MPGPSDPLKFPPHFPPTDPWKKFFIGVRWLGPDLSFFKALKSQQAARDASQMSAWGGGIRQEIAEVISNIFHERLGWGSNVFLPEDQFSVISHGPKFDILDSYALEDVMEELALRFLIEIPMDFWSGLEDATFGEVVEKIVSMQTGA